MVGVDVVEGEARVVEAPVGIVVGLVLMLVEAIHSTMEVSLL